MRLCTQGTTTKGWFFVCLLFTRGILEGMKTSRFGKFKSFVVETWSYFFSFRPTRMASSLSYYGLFALVPLLVITFWFGSVIVDTQTLSKEIIERTSYVLGHQSSSFLQTTFTNATNVGSHPLQAILAVVVLVALAVSGIAELKESLDDIWQTPYRPTSGIVDYLLTYFIPLLATIAFGIAFVLFIVGSQFLQAGFTLGMSPGVLDFFTSYGTPVVVFVITTCGTFMAYTILPERHIPRKQLLLGSVITGVFLTLGSIALGFYLTQGTTLSTYGVAGSIVAVLLWFYYSSLIFLFGASATWVHHLRENNPESLSADFKKAAN